MQDSDRIVHQRRSTLWMLAKIVLAVGLLWIVFSQTSLADILRIARDVNLIWLGGYVLACYLSLALSAERYRILIERRISFRQAFGLVLLQSAIGNLVANPAGMASYVTVLRSRYQVQVSQSVASLIVSRLADLTMIGLTLIGAAWWVWSKIAPAHVLVLVLIAGIGGLLIGLALLLILRQSLLRLIQRLLVFFRLSEVAVIRRLMVLIEQVAFQDYQTLVPWVVPVSWMSFVILMCSVLSSFSAVQMFHIPIGIDSIVFLVVIVQLLSLIPIQIFGGLGVSEISALYLYGLFGISATEIAPILVGARVLFYLINLSYLVWIAVDSFLERSHLAANGTHP